MKIKLEDRYVNNFYNTKFGLGDKRVSIYEITNSKDYEFVLILINAVNNIRNKKRYNVEKLDSLEYKSQDFSIKIDEFASKLICNNNIATKKRILRDVFDQMSMETFIKVKKSLISLIKQYDREMIELVDINKISSEKELNRIKRNLKIMTDVKNVLL